MVKSHFRPYQPEAEPLAASNIPNFEPLVGKYFTSQLIFQDRASGFRYLANAKSGSSAVKNFLIRSVLGTGSTSEKFSAHSGGWTSNVLGDDGSARPFTFSIVGNPYTRILSAYLDKIRRPGILREQFRLQYDIAPDQDISFRKFLECLTSSDVILDQHYRPQVQNLYFGYLNIDVIWPLEALDDAMLELSEQLGVAVSASVPGKHTTDVSTKLAEFFDDKCLTLARSLYREDFRAFGYSEDIHLAGAVIDTLRNVPPFEDGWFELLSADTSAKPALSTQSGGSKRLCFYTKAVQTAWEASKSDATPLLAMLSCTNSVEEEHYLLNQATSLQKSIMNLDGFENIIDRLIDIAPFNVRYRFQKIKLTLAHGGTPTDDTVVSLVHEAKKTTLNHDEINSLLKSAERTRIMEQTRSLLKAERRFLERKTEEVTIDVQAMIPAITTFAAQMPDPGAPWLAKLRRTADQKILTLDPVDDIDLPTQKLMRMTESLGDNCEYGFWQRHRAYESSSLFRWAITPIDSLLAFMDAPARLYAASDLSAHSRGMVAEQRFMFKFHSKLVERAEDDTLQLLADSQTFEEIRADEAAKIAHLQTKFFAKMKRQEALYIIKDNKGLTEEKARAVLAHLHRHNPQHHLLWVEADGNSEPAFTDRGEGLLRGCLPAFAPYASADTYAEGGWTTLMTLISRHEPIAAKIARL